MPAFSAEEAENESAEQSPDTEVQQEEDTETESEFIIIEEDDEGTQRDERFIPTVQISEDLPVAFPIDI